MQTESDFSIMILKNDGGLTIATGKSRKETIWKNKQYTWASFLSKISATTRTYETVEEYKNLPKSKQDEIKDVGGFVGGTLKGGKRKVDAVQGRHLLTLDADHLPADFDLFTVAEYAVGSAFAIYSTHKHTKETPRYRIIFPLQRAVTPEEYEAIGRKVAELIDIEIFDDTTYEPSRLMYWPSTSKDGDYVFKYSDEPWLDPDKILEMYPSGNWHDASYWPESSRKQTEIRRNIKKQGNPTEKSGLIGAFCRTYSIQDAIDEFLPDVYERVDDTRYSYVDGSTAGGLVLYDDMFAFSHHGTDPASGMLCNAWDLVRIHLFSQEDEEVAPDMPANKKPSFIAMQDFASKDKNTIKTLSLEKISEASSDFGESLNAEDMEWLTELEYSKKGEILSSVTNVVRILNNDPNLVDKLAYDDFANRLMVKFDLPWRKRDRGIHWNDSDDACLRNYLYATYGGIKGVSIIADALAEVFMKNAYHPVREYLKPLEWDGVERLDALFIDYLGAPDNEYVRAVTRKSFTAAVNRVMEPGCKFDYMLVLVGAQGVGKSLILSKLGRKWFSDSLTTVHGKEAYEQLQGSWILEMGELSATKKADVEAIKLFLSKREDIFRQAYGRHTSAFPRQCVFFGTTNDDEFLKDKTGNRRFWPVTVDPDNKTKSVWSDLNDYEVDQVWAEAKKNYLLGEDLYLKGELEKLAMEVQEMHTEEDSKKGLILDFISRKLPPDWGDYSLVDRRQFIHGSDFQGKSEGTVVRDRICAMEIWCELFQKDAGTLLPMQAREINQILRSLNGWKPYSSSRGRCKHRLYGLQRTFERI